METVLHIDDHYRPAHRGRGVRAQQSSGMLGWIRDLIRKIFESAESRNIFLFLCVNLSFAFVELIYGFWTNSLGLITDSFHMFFDCTALVAGLVASLIARWPANERFSYGYGRAQVLGGFINGLFLIFVAMFIVTEAVERFMDPPHVDTHMLLEVSVLGLLVNILGIFAFSHAHTHGGEPCSHGHSHDAVSERKRDSNVHEAGQHQHGHSHGAGGTCSGGHDADHGHGHGHGQAHDGNHNQKAHGHGHSHGADKKPAQTSHQGHGHSHGNGQVCSGHHGEQYSPSKESTQHHGHSHSAPEGLPAPATSQAIKGQSRSFVLDGVLLHVIADTLGSVSVIISSMLIQMYGWMVADPICSLFTSGLILLSVYPLLSGSVSVLMQRTPAKLDPFLLGAYQQISAINGVVQYRDPHFWTLSGSDWYGTMVLVIRHDADEQQTRKAASSVLEQLGVNRMIIQVERF
eukprot:m.190084 g.190084  ORF g.190084 m.190084 type:complete len:460 (-) comp18543_c0_seq2:359-1738(-)